MDEAWTEKDFRKPQTKLEARLQDINRDLIRENKRLREERDILEKAAAWFANRETGSKRKRRSSS